MSLLPGNLKLATIDVDQKASIETIDIKSLPQNWRNSPAPSALADIGNQWIHQHRFLVLRVPSVVVAGDFNALINPTPPQFKHAKINSIVDYEIDLDKHEIYGIFTQFNFLQVQ
jgi:RES domain-containing protein